MAKVCSILKSYQTIPESSILKTKKEKKADASHTCR